MYILVLCALYEDFTVQNYIICYFEVFLVTLCIILEIFNNEHIDCFTFSNI